jgi:hypothetical protein
MPNWCDNRVTLHHENKEKIDIIERELLKKETCQLFNTLVPRPADKEEDWYSWNVENWGCKWDASIIDWSREDDNTIIVYMDTAWAPPTKLYYALVEDYYDVDAYYHEGGMAFCGWFDNGNDNYFEYDIGDLDSIEMLPEELLEFTNLREWHEDWKRENENESYEQEEYNLEGEDDGAKSNS